ncbi:MAG: hypothetical protein ACK50U_00560 [Acidobacteriota bacterium]
MARKATLDFSLELGDVKESVLVIGGNETLETATARLGKVISPEKIVDLPLNARNFSQLITLTSGATPVSVAENNSPLFVARAGQCYFPAIKGQSNRRNSFTLDGVFNPIYAQHAQPDRYALWRQRIRHRQPVIVPVIWSSISLLLAPFGAGPSRHELVEAIAGLILGPKVDFALPAVTRYPGGQIQQAQAIRGNSPMRQLG